jgi:hypothetical protein
LSSRNIFIHFDLIITIAELQRKTFSNSVIVQIVINLCAVFFDRNFNFFISRAGIGDLYKAGGQLLDIIRGFEGKYAEYGIANENDPNGQ